MWIRTLAHPDRTAPGPPTMMGPLVQTGGEFESGSLLSLVIEMQPPYYMGSAFRIKQKGRLMRDAPFSEYVRLKY